jgi:hypothetical protein
VRHRGLSWLGNVRVLKTVVLPTLDVGLRESNWRISGLDCKFPVNELLYTTFYGTVSQIIIESKGVLFYSNITFPFIMKCNDVTGITIRNIFSKWHQIVRSSTCLRTERSNIGNS